MVVCFYTYMERILAIHGTLDGPGTVMKAFHKFFPISFKQPSGEDSFLPIAEEAEACRLEVTCLKGTPFANGRTEA